MSVLIIGADGNMGRRYQAILKYLGVKTYGIDLRTPAETILEYTKTADRYLIATPTDNHCEWIRTLAPSQKPILCEKPITRDLAELKEMINLAKHQRTHLQMVYQYEFLADPQADGPSFYSYWNHGKDGLYWDCMQIIGLAKREVALWENSPIWQCTINGKKLSIEKMDQAYINCINRWLWGTSYYPNFETMYEAHEKTVHLMQGKSC